MSARYDDSVTMTQGSATSGGAAAIAPVLPAVAGKTCYVTGFDLSGMGPTTAVSIAVTITGLLGTVGTLTYTVPLAAGATAPAHGFPGTFSIRFPDPLPASALNTAITLNVPSYGTGNLQNSATIYGFTK
jgi:hypothetical protein